MWSIFLFETCTIGFSIHRAIILCQKTQFFSKIPNGPFSHSRSHIMNTLMPWIHNNQVGMQYYTKHFGMRNGIIKMNMYSKINSLRLVTKFSHSMATLLFIWLLMVATMKWWTWFIRWKQGAIRLFVVVSRFSIEFPGYAVYH